MNWTQIPTDLQDRPQWCVAAPAGMHSAKGKEPLSVNEDGNFYLASANQPGSWLPFDVAARAAQRYGYHIGFMLHEDDPFSCIDLDVKDAQNSPDKPHLWTSREEIEAYYTYFRQFDSYSESSASGKGLHIWVRGKVGPGARRRGVEIYSQNRFMITTGDVINAKPIEDRTLMIQSFAEFIRPRGIADDVVLTEEPEDEDDFYVLRKAVEAENSDKFLSLWKGNWEGIYPSQSEADLALMSMFAFYSKSNAQCRRLFRESGLGSRDKALKDDRYVNYTLRAIRRRIYNEKLVDASAVVQQAEHVIRDRNEQYAKEELARLQGTTKEVVEAIPMHVLGQPAPVREIPNTAAALAMAAPLHPAIVSVQDEGIPWPPGIVGKIAHFVYRSAPRPVKEVAIVAAIGLMAGLAGKAWHTKSMSGLNMYVVLVAKSAIGKEAMNTGLSLLVKEVSKVNPLFAKHVCFDSFASGPALTKFVATQSSFVNINGEWGKRLKLMARSEDGRNQAIDSLRTVMTDLYQKSGPDSIVGGIKYSQADNNTVGSITGVAYSMIGETTPGTFYEALTEDMMSDGFLSRFLTIEHNGLRPRPNESQLRIPDSALVEVLSNISTMANKVATFTAPSKQVEREESAAEILADFEEECDEEINKSDNESYRQMWNRASLKAQRLGCLLAVADHHLFPVMTVQHINWAIEVVRRDIAIMRNRIDIGDIGVTDYARHRKLMAVIRHYMQSPLPKGRADQQKFKDKYAVTREYLQVYTRTSMAFNKFRGGAVQALELAIKAFIDMGYIAEYSKPDSVRLFGFQGKCYRLLSIPDITDEA